jgi:hypothetical protein
VPKWEYLTWGTDDAFGYTGSHVNHVNGEDATDERSIYEALAKAGEDGWELVSAIQTKYRVVLMLKRPVPEG